MTKIAHRWSPILQKVNQKRKQADQFKARLVIAIPDNGIATCAKENPHGFRVGDKYTFRKDIGHSYAGRYNRIFVHGDARRGIWDWAFFDNDEEFHTFFSLA